MPVKESWKLSHTFSKANKEEIDNIIYQFLGLELPEEKSEDGIPIFEGMEIIEAASKKGLDECQQMQDKNKGG
eukprot:6122392-Ditylum_brightwellii.AAC.1